MVIKNEQEILNRLNMVEAGHEQLKEAIEANTILTQQIQTNTQDIIDLFQTAKGGLKTAVWLGGMIKWGGGVLGGVVGAYLAVKAYLGQP
jgi:uncharacterized membrane protein YoaK (UPF0700 family)